MRENDADKGKERGWFWDDVAAGIDGKDVGARGIFGEADDDGIV